MSVLVLQGNGAERDQLISSLETHGFQPVRTLTTAAGLDAELANREGLAAILVDLALDEDLTACQQIRATDPTIPLLVLFDDDSATHLRETLAIGASGCVPEPLNPLELVAKLRAAIRQHRHILRAEPEEIRPSAEPLTNLANDRCFRLNLDRAWRRDWQGKAAISLIVLNIDHFAQFNNLYGRAAGDDCLRRIAGTIQSALYRPDDLAAHRGSGEFTVFSPERITLAHWWLRNSFAARFWTWRFHMPSRGPARMSLSVWDSPPPWPVPIRLLRTC